MSPRSLIIGASGQVGQQMLELLDSSNVVLGSSRAVPGSILFDLGRIADQPNKFRTLLGKLNIGVIYCLGGLTDVDGCELDPVSAMKVNGHGPIALARLAAEMHIRYVYFSTDYVFDGQNGPYNERDATNPLSVYGRSKAVGELGVMTYHPQALVLRTTVVFGRDRRRKNFLYSLRAALSSEQSFRVASDQISTPTFNHDLAIAVLHLVHNGAVGIYHVAGPDTMTRAEFAVKAAQLMGLDAARIVPVPTACLNQRASRPLNAGLHTSKLDRSYPTVRMRSVEEALELCCREIE